VATLCLSISLNGQTPKKVVIELENPSFEGFPSMGKLPDGWFDCGRPSESPPDVQPGQFGVVTLPKHGDSYIGMVVRDNDTWEATGQRLRLPLQKDHCYDFAMDMCRSETYISPSRKSGASAHYTSAVKILVWGGNDYCDKRELLAETSMVTNPRWLTFIFPLRPKKGSYNYIMFEAYYQTPVLFPYNGNVLMDNATIIQEVNCAAKPEIPPTKHAAPGTVASAPKTKPSNNEAGTSVTNRPVTHDAPQGNVKLNKAKKGEVVRLERITFKADSYELRPESEPSLQEVYDFLSSNPEVIVEVGGHTNGIPPDEFCDSLSTNRAKNVANWLIQKGIAPERVQYKGYGKRKKLASDSTQDGRNQNQRVEVKILARNG
jgi:outer membrane protein OmpA-like peptidoglycan-associated protein